LVRPSFTLESGTFADMDIISSYLIVNISYCFSIVASLAIEHVMGSMEATSCMKAYESASGLRFSSYLD
jgi:hypothetical protein